MASIRTRLTATYGLAVFCVMLVFALTFSAERTSVGRRELEDRSRTIANLAVRMVEQSGVSASGVRILVDTTNRRRADTSSSVGPQFNPRFVALLDVLPEYVIITDSTRQVIYVSNAVHALTPFDSATLASEVSRLGTADACT